jgi:hypothetical protein
MIDDHTPPDWHDAADHAKVEMSAQTARELLHRLVEIKAELDRVETRLRLAFRKSSRVA